MASPLGSPLNMMDFMIWFRWQPATCATVQVFLGISRISASSPAASRASRTLFRPYSGLCSYQCSSFEGKHLCLLCQEDNQSGR